MWMSSSQRPRRSQPVRSRPRSGSSRCLSSAACHDMFVWSAAALYPFSVSLCVMSRGILCTGSLDVICHASVCGRGVSGVCETCATFWPRKWQYRPRNGSTFPLRNLLRKDFSLQRGGSARKKRSFFFYFFAFFTLAGVSGAHIGSMTAVSRLTLLRYLGNRWVTATISG